MSTEKKDEPEIEIVESATVPVAEEKPEPDETEEDGRLSAEAKAEEDDEKPDADPLREKLRQERRLRRKVTKELQKELRDKERNELEELRRQNRELGAQVSKIQQTQNGTLEQNLKERIRQAIAVHNRADEELGLAIEAGDGKRAREALQARDEAREAAQAMDVQLRKMAAPPRQTGPDPTEARLVQEWVKKNTWYDPNGGNEESRIARTINDTLINEGYRPNTPAFWEQLDQRVSKYVRPAVTKKPKARDEAEDIEVEDAPAPRRGGPPVGGSGRESSPSAGKLVVHVTPERKRALQEAGVWDDPAARAKYLRRYAEFDRNNQAAR
jgi:hypothetical protein